MADSIEQIRPWRTIERRKSRQIMVGDVPVGGDAPIAVQSMTNTVTHDIDATVRQVRELEEAGADIVRISCPDPESSLALKDITKEISVPIVADIHFHYKRGIEAAESGAACLRINPGNGQRSGCCGPRQWLLYSDRCQWRLARTGLAGEIWRALP